MEVPLSGEMQLKLSIWCGNWPGMRILAFLLATPFRILFNLSIFVTVSSGQGLAEIKDRLAGGTQSHPFVPERQSLTTQTFATGFAVQHRDKSLASVCSKGTIPISSNSLHPLWVSPCSDKAKLT